MNSLEHAIEKVRNAPPESRWYAERYKLSRRVFLIIFDYLDSRREVPSAHEFECLYFALRHVHHCSNDRKKELFAQELPSDISKKCCRYLKDGNKGMVGGGKGSVKEDLKYIGARRQLWGMLSSVYTARNEMEADAILAKYAQKPVSGLLTSTLSPFFWALRPKSYPIVNGGSLPGMSRVFINFKKPTSLSAYVYETTPALRKLAHSTGVGFHEFDRIFVILGERSRGLPVKNRLPYEDWRITTIESAIENERRTVQSIHRTRSRKLREAVLAKRGYACEICDFDFEQVYGIPYAEVHHIEPASTVKGPRVVKESDLLVVCRNCHAMLHTPAYDLDCQRLRNAVRRRRKNV